MGNNSLKVGVQQLGKPEEVAVIRGVTGVNDCGYLVGAQSFVLYASGSSRREKKIEILGNGDF